MLDEGAIRLETMIISITNTRDTNGHLSVRVARPWCQRRVESGSTSACVCVCVYVKGYVSDSKESLLCVCVRAFVSDSLYVPAQPYGGEVAPPQFPDHMVPAVEQIPDLHRVVAS